MNALPFIDLCMALLLAATSCSQPTTPVLEPLETTEVKDEGTGRAQRPISLIENAAWRLRTEENASFMATANSFIYFEHADTVPYEIKGDTLWLNYGDGLATMNSILYMTPDSFSISSETGDNMVFDRMP